MTKWFTELLDYVLYILLHPLTMPKQRFKSPLEGVLLALHLH